MRRGLHPLHPAGAASIKAAPGAHWPFGFESKASKSLRVRCKEKKRNLSTNRLEALVVAGSDAVALTAPMWSASEGWPGAP